MGTKAYVLNVKYAAWYVAFFGNPEWYKSTAQMYTLQPRLDRAPHTTLSKSKKKLLIARKKRLSIYTYSRLF